MSDTRSPTSDPRGHMHRATRLMGDDDARAFLRAQKVAHVGTVDEAGWPYVIPLIYIYEGDDRLYLHTGDHHRTLRPECSARSASLASRSARWVQYTEGDRSHANSALVFTSVIVFGPVRILGDRDRKSWFFDRVLEKYGDPEWTFQPGYPLLDRIILYEQQMEIVTGKHSEGLRH